MGAQKADKDTFENRDEVSISKWGGGRAVWSCLRGIIIIAPFLTHSVF